MRVVDFIAERLIELGVRHVFGVGGANIEDLFSAVQRRRPQIAAVLCAHEHAAGTAADAYARINGFGAVMTTSGGGAMNLVHSLAEARASHVPLIAIVGEPPLALQGRGAFQDTSGRAGTVDANAVFEAAAHCLRVTDVGCVRKAWDEAVGFAFANSGPVVLLIAKDVQCAELPAGARVASVPRRWTEVVPDEAAVADAMSWLGLRPVLVIAGSSIARTSAREELAAFVETLDASLVATPDGRDAFDNEHPRFVGVLGAMGHDAAARALAESALVVAIGTRLPQLARQGVEAMLEQKRVLSIGHDAPFVSCAENVHLFGAVKSVLRALLARLPNALAERRDRVACAPPPAASAPGFSLTAALAALDRAIPADAIVLVDAGNSGASAIYQLRAPRSGRFLVAMGMAGMGFSFGAATGAAYASGKRCVVVAGDGAFLMNGMEVHTAVEHDLPITYVLLNNRAHGMCLVRERLLLGEHAGYNAFRPSHLGAGLVTMFPGLLGGDATTLGEFEQLIQRAFAARGPSVVAVELEDVEVPPFVAFRERAPSVTRIEREVMP